MQEKYRESGHTTATLSDLLSQKHVKMLRDESAISEEIIASRGYYTETDPKGLAEIGFDKKQQKLVPALVIPVRDVTGKVVLHRIRPDEPRSNPRKPEKVNKYETPTGSQNVLDIPPFTFARLGDGMPLWFTEGEKKADALVSRGVAAIGILGVWSWKRDGLPLRDFDKVPMLGRDVRIIFDSDAEENVNVRQALYALGRYMKARTGNV